jgi:hypothetical protein
MFKAGIKHENKNEPNTSHCTYRRKKCKRKPPLETSRTGQTGAGFYAVADVNISVTVNSIDHNYSGDWSGNSSALSDRLLWQRSGGNGGNTNGCSQPGVPVIAGAELLQKNTDEYTPRDLYYDWQLHNCNIDPSEYLSTSSFITTFCPF